MVSIARGDDITASAIVELDGTEADIQAALDGLTSGRTSKEKVVAIGDFTISNPITVPSFTILEIQGSLTGTSANNGVIENADATNTDIEIIGGLIDVDNTSTPWNKRGIEMTGVSNLLIRGVHAKDSGTHCISLIGCDNFIVENCHAENAGDDGISAVYSYDGRIDNNYVIGGTNNSNGGGSAGIEIEDGCLDIAVTNNVVQDIQDTAASCIHVITDSGGTAGCHNISISNNVIRNTSSRGIGVINNKADDTISALSADGDGTVEITSTGHGMTASSTWRVLIQGVDDSGLTGINGYHVATYVDANTVSIPVTATGTYTSGGSILYDHSSITVSNNTINETNLNGIQIEECQNFSVAGNVLANIGLTAGQVGISVASGTNNGQLIGNAVTNSGDDGIACISSNQILVSGNTVIDAGFTTINKYSILMSSATNCVISNNQCIDTRDTLRAYGIRSLSGGPNYVFGNEVNTCKANGTQVISNGTGDEVYDNKGSEGVTNSNSGTGSITSGGTTDVITHGLNITPALADIHITLGENPTNTPGAVWVDTIGATTFTVNCENDPGASNLDFSWKVTRPV